MKNNQPESQAANDNMEPIEQSKKQMSAVKDRLRIITRNKEIRNGLFKLADKADENAALVKVREFWNEMPHAAQWAILHMPGVVNVHSDILKMMIKLGLIEYKGAKSEKDIQNMSKWEDIKLEWTVKIGKYFIPELKAVEALLKPAMEIKGVQNELLTDVRFHLKETRVKKEDAKKIVKIKTNLNAGKKQKKAA